MEEMEMKQSKHTPGPYRAVYNPSRNEYQIYGGSDVNKYTDEELIDGKYTTMVYYITTIYDPDEARLIAASPEMYDFILEKAQAGDKEAQSIISDINDG